MTNQKSHMSLAEIPLKNEKSRTLNISSDLPLETSDAPRVLLYIYIASDLLTAILFPCSS